MAVHPLRPDPDWRATMRRRAHDAAVGDSAVRLRVHTVRAGVAVTVVLMVPLVAWLVWTKRRPFRPEMAAILVAALVGTVVVGLLPAERIVRSRLREAFFLTWSALDIAAISALAWLDGGIGSPATLVLFLTLAFAALSYPLLSMAMVVGFTAVAVAALQLVSSPGAGGFHPDAPYSMMLLVSLALTGVLCVWQASLHASQRTELARLSRTDPLTGCLNRRGFAERLDAELRAAERPDADVALALLDLDDFKAVNDAHGHAAGDELLRWVASTVGALTRGEDVVGRLGGDEFAVVLPGGDLASAQVLAERLAAALAERIGASVGIATRRRDGHDAEMLHRRADARLYARKRAGLIARQDEPTPPAPAC